MSDLTSTFRAALATQRTEVVEVATREDAVRTIAELAGERRVVDVHPDLDGLATTVTDVWDAEAGVSVAHGASADTGTLAIVAGPGRPRSHGMNPLHHIVLLRASTLLATYGELAASLATDPMPSYIRLTSGPSRSGDIELKTIYGLHGPRRITVVLWDDSPR